MKKIVYFDNAATSYPKPKTVLKAMKYYFEKVGGSPGRSGHRMSISASRLIEDVRETVAKVFNCPDTSRIIFTKNITEAINICLFSLLKSGDNIVTTSIEHNSVMRPIRYLEQNGISVSIVNCFPDGSIDPNAVSRKINKKTKLVISTHASNVIGTILPIEEIALITKEKNIPFLIDCAQTAGAIPIDIDLQKFTNCILGFTGHKGLLGPTGTGGMCIGTDVNISSLIHGGTGSNSDKDIQPDFLPDKLESGTINIVGIAGLKAGIDFLINEGIPKVREHEKNLVNIFIKNTDQIKSIKIYGTKDPDKQIGLISFNVKNLSPSEVCFLLDYKYSIMSRTGLHCNPNAHKTIGTFPDGTVRFSFSYFNTVDQVKKSILALKELSMNKYN